MRKGLRKPLIPALVALIGLGVLAEIWYSRRAGIPDSPSPTPAPSASISAEVIPPLPTGSLPPLSSPTPAPTFAPPDEAAMIEIDKVNLMLRDYRTIAGENPVGTNAEIMAAVMGGNEKRATLGPPEGVKLNDKGELIDRWGTPFFFHQISREHMEIRSAGADKILWTEDDPIVK